MQIISRSLPGWYLTAIAAVKFVVGSDGMESPIVHGENYISFREGIVFVVLGEGKMDPQEPPMPSMYVSL